MNYSRLSKPMTTLVIALAVSCTSKEADVKIKVGVVMESGDIKVVARQNVVISKVDLMTVWNEAKKQNWKGVDLIERQIRLEMNYEEKKASLEREETSYQRTIDKLINHNNPAIDRLKFDLAVQVQTAIISGNLIDKRISEIFEALDNRFHVTAEKTSYREIIQFTDLFLWTLKELIKASPPVPPEDEIPIDNLTARAFATQRDTWKESLAEVNKIKSKLDGIASNLTPLKENVSRMNEEIKKLKEELDYKINLQFEASKSKALKEFQDQAAGTIVLKQKTNLNGEALIKIPKGTYHLFCIAELANKYIIWSLPIKVDRREQYFELSNDTAISDKDGVQFGEMAMAMEGIPLAR